MVGRGRLGLLGFGAAAVGGVGFGLLARQRAADWRRRLEADPEWAELSDPIRGEIRPVTSFDGTTLHAEVLGPDDAPTIVLVHGYALSLDVWHYQRRDLAGEFRILAYDQRGHARSGRAASGDYSIGALGRDLAAVLDALVPAGQRAVAVGHSLGGMSILSLANEHPTRVRRLLAGAVFVDSTGSDVLAGGFASTGVAALSVLSRTATARIPWRRHNAPEGDLTTLLTRAVGFGPDASPAQVAFVEQLTIDTPNSVKADLGPTLTATDLRDAAPLLDVPALVLVGAHDRLTPPSSAAKLARALPDATLIELAGAGHNAMLEAHPAVTSHLRAFTRARWAAAA
jgi:pimeloyl-ACP methyl ester carboxylesterase